MQVPGAQERVETAMQTAMGKLSPGDLQAMQEAAGINKALLNAGKFAQQIAEAPENAPSASQDYDTASKLHQVAEEHRTPGNPTPMAQGRTLSKDYKRQLLDQVYTDMMHMAERGNHLMRQLEH
jgi:hypothetical protein